MSDPCRIRWVTPAGSTCPPITRCDSLIRHCCQSSDARTPTTTGILWVGVKRRDGNMRMRQRPMGQHQLHGGTLGAFVRETVKSFLYRLSAGFRKSHLKEYKETGWPVGLFSCKVQSERTLQLPLVGKHTKNNMCWSRQ